MFTPSGRFQPDKKICFSMSDFHPGSVGPLLSLGALSFDTDRIDLPQVESRMERCHDVRAVLLTIIYIFDGTQSYPDIMFFFCFRLTGLVSFMLSDEMTTGSVTTLDADKRVYASRSHAWNLQQRRFREAFPEVSTHVLYVSKLYPPDIAPNVYHDCGA